MAAVATQTSRDTTELMWYLKLKLAALGQPTATVRRSPVSSRSPSRCCEVTKPKTACCATICVPPTPGFKLFSTTTSTACVLRAFRGCPRAPWCSTGAGLARVMSLPPNSASFSSPYLRSYRVPQGILHNPRSDRRTTKGVFHIAEGGFPIPADKQPVPIQTFAALLRAALAPPTDVLTLPFTAEQPQQARLFVSLLIRPLVCPATGTDHTGNGAKTMEIRFFAPASLVSNLDFVESIFGNAGDPHLPENDAALDVMHWTGHTGCVILAPHLVGMKKAALGLPHKRDATDRQIRDGMCWESEDEPYNDGNAFKICCRDHRGVMVTVIADNYYGYCKKEVKTQISFSANLYGLCEEEHAGGAMAFATYVLGQDFDAGRTVSLKKATFEQGMEPARRHGRAQTGGIRDRPALSGYLLHSGRRRIQRPRRPRELGARR